MPFPSGLKSCTIIFSLADKLSVNCIWIVFWCLINLQNIPDMDDNHFKFSNAVIGLPVFFVLFLWILYWFQLRFDVDFYKSGIYPWDFSGLQVILFCHFIHENLSHLYNNSIPLLFLLAALKYFYPKQSIKVIIFGILFSVLITWLIGRENYHIGASGLIYVLVSFIFFKVAIFRVSYPNLRAAPSFVWGCNYLA